MDWELRCPLCGGMMTLRTARYGSSAGNDFWGCARFPACKGSLNFDGSSRDSSAKERRSRVGSPQTTLTRAKGNLPTTTSGKGTTLRRGDLLVSSSNSLGPGKLVDKDGEDLVLEYFDTPGQAPRDRERRSISRRSLRRYTLKLETRVFWISGQKWQSGRVLETAPDGEHYVRSHNWEGFVSEENLYVRWHRPLRNPVGFAAGGLLESPLLADLRRPFLQAVLQQRSAARGMKSALSSAIELHDHQLQTAWRVLQDPVQRYLLADEVGLGKTIEAGIIMRQLLLDNPEFSVQLILPPFLVGQWRQELTNKFFLQDFPRSDIRFSRDDEPATWAPADLLIIDEAHNLAALANSQQAELAARYAALAETATASKRLLMLSATPALNNEPVFLQMLKLLDPAVYRDMSVDDLRHRLAARSGLGRIFLGLQPTLPAVLLRNRLADLRNELAGDGEVAKHLDDASTALAVGDRDALVLAIEDIRTHVAEIYRVHRRMLRTRRTSALQTTYRVTGRKFPEPLTLESGLLTETTRLLEAWRQEVLAAHEEDLTALQSAANALAQAVSLSLDPESLAEWARSRTATTRGEQMALDRIIQDLGFVCRRDTVSKPIADALSYRFKAGEKVVVFCSTAALVTELGEELRHLLPDTVVLEHRITDTLEHIDTVIRQFESERGTTVLIADSSAEEGRNFQFADLLVHVGVQSDANRMEQRIGRCDRWQMTDAAGERRSLTVTESSSSETFSSVWTRILQDGFGVFDSSIASLQLAVETATANAWQKLLTDGVESRDAIVELVRSSLKEEIERIREQDALDSIEASTDRGSIYSQLTASEATESEFAELSHALLASVPGNLRFRATGDPVHGVGCYDAFSRPPGMQLQIPLVPLERLERHFLPIRNQRGTYLRRAAIKHKDTHLYRYGDPFIEAVSDFLWHDDRGRAFGMWRWRPDWGYGERIAYRFDYAIEAKPDEKAFDLPSGETVTLMHRADGLFPPLIVTVWVDELGRQLSDSSLLNVLQEPYAKPDDTSAGGDYSLNRSRIEAAYQYIPAPQWSKRWQDAEACAVNLVMSLAEVQGAIKTGLDHAAAESAKRVKQLRLRSARVAGNEHEALEREVAFEEAVGRSLCKAIENPALRLDSTGVVILSAEELASGEDV